MAKNSFHTNRLLWFLESSDNEIRQKILGDIKMEEAIKRGEKLFIHNAYVNFWADFKKYICKGVDLHKLINDRIKTSPNNKGTYNLLRDNALVFWSNEHSAGVESSSLTHPTGSLPISDIDLTVKAQNMLAITTKTEGALVYYPYWYKEHELSEKNARIGLWLLNNALKSKDSEDIRILDIKNRKYFSINTLPLIGDEEEILKKEYERIRTIRQELEEER